MGTIHRQRAVLNLQKKNSPLLLDKAKAIYNGLSGNPTLFVDPNPSLITLQDQILVFDKAHQAAGTRIKGAAAVRDAKALDLITSLETARAYVQSLADASPEQGAILIEAAAMKIAQVTSYSKPLLQVIQGKASGTTRILANVGLLTASTGRKVFFNWQYSGDGGKTWMTAPSTPHGHTNIADLTPMETYSFRVSVTDAEGPGAWSQVVTVLVH